MNIIQCLTPTLICLLCEKLEKKKSGQSHKTCSFFTLRENAFRSLRLCNFVVLLVTSHLKMPAHFFSLRFWGIGSSSYPLCEHFIAFSSFFEKNDLSNQISTALIKIKNIYKSINMRLWGFHSDWWRLSTVLDCCQYLNWMTVKCKINLDDCGRSCCITAKWKAAVPRGRERPKLKERERDGYYSVQVMQKPIVIFQGNPGTGLVSDLYAEEVMKELRNNKYAVL